jgi:hypothetical protein
MGITGEASQNGHRFIGAGLPLSWSNSVGILAVAFLKSFTLLDLVRQDLDHPLSADLLKSAPEPNQVFDVHDP